MAWDREGYRRDVLDPARQSGNVPPPDCTCGTACRRDIGDPGAFAAQVAAVLGYWRELANSRTYAPLAQARCSPRTARLERDGPLTLQRFAARHAQARRESLERLARLADTEAGAATHAGPATVARLRDAAGGRSATPTSLRRSVRRASGSSTAFPSAACRAAPEAGRPGPDLQPLGLSAVGRGRLRRCRARRFPGPGRVPARRRASRLDDRRDRRGAGPGGRPALHGSGQGAQRERPGHPAHRGAPARRAGHAAAVRGRRTAAAAGARRVPRSGPSPARPRELGLDEDEAGLIAAAVLAPDALESHAPAGHEASWPRAGYAARSGWGPDCPPPTRCTSASPRWTPRSPRSAGVPTRNWPWSGASRRPACWPRP